MSKEGLLVAGDLYFERKLDGVWGGLLPFGNCTKMEIKENAEIKKRKSKGKTDYGQVVDAVGVKGEAEMSVELDSVDADSMALIFLGDKTDVDITGASATDEPHVAHLDTFIKLDFRDISALTITGFVLGTDFEITDAKTGLIKILSGGTVTENAALLISYTYASMTAEEVTGGTNPSIKIRLYLDGYNLVTQKDLEVHVWEAELTPDNGVDFLSDDFVTGSLSGTPIKPADKPSAYKVISNIN